MGRPTPQRDAVCCHCSRRFAVSPMARTMTCPACYQRLSLDDIVVEGDYAASRLLTCGRVIVGKRARVSVKSVRASQGIEVLGTLRSGVGEGESGGAATAGYVLIGPGASWTGDCRATSLVVHPGAKVFDGLFRIVPPSQAADAAGCVTTPVASNRCGGAPAACHRLRLGEVGAAHSQRTDLLRAASRWHAGRWHAA